MMDVTRAVLAHFRANRAGVIVNVSSGAGIFTLPMISLYCASKFALEGFSEALTYELAPLGITVKIVEPGGSGDTNFHARTGSEAAAAAIPDDYKAVVADVARRLKDCGLSPRPRPMMSPRSSTKPRPTEPTSFAMSRPTTSSPGCAPGGRPPRPTISRRCARPSWPAR